MLLDELRDVVYRANIGSWPQSGLVLGTFGNVSAVDRTAGVFVIKPSGVPYEELTPEHMVAGLARDRRGDRRPAPSLVRHPDAPRAVSRVPLDAAASSTRTPSTRPRSRRRGMPIRCMGTTHADYFRGDIPVTRPMTRGRSGRATTRRTRACVIVETFAAGGIVAVGGAGGARGQSRSVHLGPGRRSKADRARRVLEYLARIEWRVATLAPDAPRPEAHSSSTSTIGASTGPARTTGRRIDRRGPVGSRRHARRFRASFTGCPGATRCAPEGRRADLRRSFSPASGRRTIASCAAGSAPTRTPSGCERIGEAKEAEYRRLAREAQGSTPLPGATRVGRAPAAGRVEAGRSRRPRRGSTSR